MLNEDIMDKDYIYPTIQLLDNEKNTSLDKNDIIVNSKRLQKVLISFNVNAKVENVIVGPTITLYEIKLGNGVRVSKIKNLKEDLAYNIGRRVTNIQIISQKGLVGIEVENVTKNIVKLKEIIDTEEFRKSKSMLTIALGKDIYDNNKIIDIEKTSHILISGTACSGKSVFLHNIINSIMFKANPEAVRFLMINTSTSELSIYNEIPHLLTPIINVDSKGLEALAWIVQEIKNRYTMFADIGVKDYKQYNKREDIAEKLPYIIIIIDEYADFIMLDRKKEKEDLIKYIVQNAEKVGIYIIITTELPSRNVVRGSIKANINTRVAFKVTSQAESKTILDTVGAEKLFGEGDMLFKERGKIGCVRCQCAYLSENEIKRIVDFVKVQKNKYKSVNFEKKIEQVETNEQKNDGIDPILTEVIRVGVEEKYVSTSLIQRKFKIGYARAARIIDQMEERGIISTYMGSKPRKVLVSKTQRDK